MIRLIIFILFFAVADTTDTNEIAIQQNEIMQDVDSIKLELKNLIMKLDSLKNIEDE